MTVQPHIAQARAVCLRCAVDTRTGGDSVGAILARAQEFEAYVLRDNADLGAASARPKTVLAERLGQKAGQPRV